MMAVGFREIPANLRVPLFFAELDNSRANGAPQPQRALIIGQQLAAGTYAPGVPALAEGLIAVKAKAGAGSMLALMLEAYRKRDRFGEVYLLPLADPGAGVAASGQISVTAAASAAGTLSLYLGERRVQVGVSPAMSTSNVAAAIVGAVTADTDLPVTASATAGVVTFTVKHKGAVGNEVGIRLNHLGAAGGEATPAGLALSITPMANGTAAPSLDMALASLGDMTFDFVVCPYTDTASLDSLKAFLAARWAWDRMLYGGAFAAYRGTLSAATTFGLARNDSHVSVMPFNDSPTPAWIWAANFAAAAAESLRADPGLPLQTLQLDVLAPPVASRWTMSERNTLLFDGLSTFTVADDGTVALETVVTTYQRNALGQPDDSYLYVERLYTLAAVIRDLKAFVTSTFGRFKLVSDGTPARPESRTVTPSLIRAALLGRYRFLERRGLVQEYEAFERSLVVERNGQNRCRVDGLLPIVPIDQLRQLAALVQFRNAGEG